MTTLLIATRNLHKVEEIRAVLGEGFRYLGLADFPGAPTVVEDADTFAGNATKKAVDLAAWLGTRTEPAPPFSGAHRASLAGDFFVLADDSGLEVDALGGVPGVHSAGFAALDASHTGNSPDAENNAKLLRLLAAVPAAERTARFRCVIALTPVLRTVPPPAPLVLESQLRERTELYLGVCPGRIGHEARGDKGFGYDPLFIPDGFACTLAELGETIKNQISHRARALAKLKRRWPELASARPLPMELGARLSQG
jgi:XTP/dITP diphosphohydrolase